MDEGGDHTVIDRIIAFLSDPASWQGPEGIPTRLLEHVEYSVIAVVIGLAVALPLGLLIGHTGRGTTLVATVANSLRALPTIGLLIFFVVLISPHVHGKGDAAYLVPSEIVLVLLAIPPILSNTYAGVQNVDPAARDAAVGMGMTGRQVLFGVELPCALPLVMSGLRSAALQVIATATIAAYVSLGGLGRMVFDGQAQQLYPKMVTGAVLVALLAMGTDLLLAALQRVVVSRGLSGRYARSRTITRDEAPAPDLTDETRTRTAV